MHKFFKQFFSAFILFSIAINSLHAQRVAGKWYGIGNAEVQHNTNNYLCEFILQQNGNKVTGEFNYYFRNAYFSNKIKGTYNADNRLLLIKFTPVMYYANTDALNGVDVNMEGMFMLKISQSSTTLSGTFTSDDLHKYTCAPIKINFRKKANDEPTLKEQFGKMKPLEFDTSGATIALVKQPAVPVATGIQPGAPQKPLPTKTEVEVKKRTNKFIRILDVTDDSVRLDFYDNGTMDYDTLSVFFNNQLVQYKRLLDTKTPISFYVKVDSNEMNNDIVMFAENLGKIPPNAALMVVTDSKERYEVSLESNYVQNALVRLRKKYRAVMRTNVDAR